MIKQGIDIRDEFKDKVKSFCSLHNIEFNDKNVFGEFLVEFDKVAKVIEYIDKLEGDRLEKQKLSKEAGSKPYSNNVLGIVVFTKDMFIKAIHEIERQYNHDRKCSDAFKVILPNDHTSNYDNHWLQNQLIEILKIAMNDNHKDSWIEYYIWELDFGRKWKQGSVQVNGKNFRIQNAYDLWDLLNLV